MIVQASEEADLHSMTVLWYEVVCQSQSLSSALSEVVAAIGRYVPLAVHPSRAPFTMRLCVLHFESSQAEEFTAVS
jgi:hypothetical protein